VNEQPHPVKHYLLEKRTGGATFDLSAACPSKMGMECENLRQSEDQRKRAGRP